jgi:hypothetical protein
MVLLDHFHPPLKVRRHWHSFHHAWATFLASSLNQYLPEGWVAEPHVQFGIEIDVATLETQQPALSSMPHQISQSGVSAAPKRAWTPPQPAKTIPFTPATDKIEVQIYDSSSVDLTLVGAIELVSPANKDRAEHRQAFVSKCETFLHQGIGLVIVDVVTERTANLHKELMTRLDPPSAGTISDRLYAVAYRVIKRDEQTHLDIWQESLNIGQSLPTLPLWLRNHLCLPVELQETYERTCRELKISFDEFS